MRWYWWYTIVIMAGTAMTFQHDPVGLLYALPINWLLYFLPTWGIVALVRHSRKPPKPEPVLLDTEPDDNTLPNMTRVEPSTSPFSALLDKLGL